MTLTSDPRTDAQASAASDTPHRASPSSANKRELTRQYKQAPPAMGVYAIRNLATRQVYLNASLNMDGAMNRDRFELKQKAHRHKALLKDWLAQGAEGFAFEVVDVLKPREEPGIDYKPELAELLALWTEEFQRRGEIGYAALR